MKKTTTAVGLLVCIALVTCLFLALSNPPARGASDTVAAITQLEKDGLKADLANDSSWVKKNLAQDFVSGDSFGAWETRAETVKDAEDTTIVIPSEAAVWPTRDLLLCGLITSLRLKRFRASLAVAFEPLTSSL